MSCVHFTVIVKHAQENCKKSTDVYLIYETVSEPLSIGSSETLSVS